MSTVFTEIADRVYLLRQPMLDVNVTLVVGDGEALVVDTLSTAGQAAELVAAARAVTPAPLTVVNTHHHFDHCFGNATIAGDPPRPVYAHEAAVALLRERPQLVRRQAYEEMLPSAPELAAELARTPLLAPTHVVQRETILDLGGRPVTLRHLGRGHTDGDLVVHVPDAQVLVVGDLVEESGPLAFDDGYPLEWAETLDQMLRLITPDTAVVPGHGSVVGPDFVRAQHESLVTLGWLIRDGHRNRSLVERVAECAPFTPEAALTAVQRGYAELTNGV
ncbi:MBL fold metallo-hydrolase [Plantactinospora sp. CA-290183]|uniref:MBL fold metallo-hydrolase n=1 Tax=Plantactinospora sp. CA-290183 TaxID=3240006 RepID=UPI003D8FCC6B